MNLINLRLTKSRGRVSPLCRGAARTAFVVVLLSAGNALGQGGPDRAASAIEDGMQLLRARNFVAALSKFTAAIRLDPQSADAFTWRGITENNLIRYAAAEQDFNSAIKLKPDELSAHYNLALTYIRLGKADSAIKELTVVLQAQPGVLDPEYNLALLLEKRKETAAATQHLQAAHQTAPDDTGVIQHLLSDLFLLGRVGEAQPLLEQVQREAPEEQEQLAAALVASEQFKAAIPILEHLQVTNAGNHSDLLLSRAYIGNGEYLKAISILEPLSRNDKSGEMSYLLGLAYSGAGDNVAAKGAFQRSEMNHPGSGAVHYHLGLIAANGSSDKTAAIKELREAVRLEPQNSSYDVKLGQLLLETDQPREAAALLQRIRPAEPSAAEANLLLGIALISNGNPKAALQVLNASLEADPTLSLSHNMLGFCYFQQGEYAKAADAYKRASDLEPASLVFAHNAAIAFDRANEDKQAMIYAKRAVALPAAGGEDHYLIGKLLAGEGLKDDAVRELREAVTLSPDLDKPYYLLARTYMQMGDHAQATEWNTRLIELKQRHDQAYRQTKAAKPPASSALLKGASIAASDSEAP